MEEFFCHARRLRKFWRYSRFYNIIRHNWQPLSRRLGLSEVRYSAAGLAVIAALAVLFVPSHRAQAQNLVLNPGFEESTDDGNGEATSTPDWSVNEGFGTIFLNNPDAANSGNWYAEFNSSSTQQALSGALSQTVATTPGTTYIVSFFLSNSGTGNSTFSATFGGQTVASLTNQSPFQYTMFSQQITVASTTAALTFMGEHGDSGPFELDDVSVVAEGAPAPVTGGGILSFAVILAGLTACRMRARRGAGRA
jgi:hypothetical protein